MHASAAISDVLPARGEQRDELALRAMRPPPRNLLLKRLQAAARWPTELD
jgi:hypothetical protein